MAYNRWLSSQYSYNPGYDLMHYGRKGMRWGKHIFGLPEITLNGGGGGAVDLEELKTLLEQGKITLDEFKARAEKHFQSVADVNKDGLKQVQDKFADYIKKVSDTYENFKAGDSADKKPDKRKFSSWDPDDVKDKFDRTDDYDARKTHDYWVRSNRGTTTVLTDRELDKDYRNNRAKMKKKAAEEKRSAADTARINSKIQDRKGQESRDRKENLERKRAERASAPRTLSESSNQNASSKSTSKDGYSLEDVVKLAFGSASTSSSTSTRSARTPNQNKEPKTEEYDVTAKQRKIYQTIGKFLNYALTITNPYHGTINGLKKTVKAIKR